MTRLRSPPANRLREEIGRDSVTASVTIAPQVGPQRTVDTEPMDVWYANHVLGRPDGSDVLLVLAYESIRIPRLVWSEAAVVTLATDCAEALFEVAKEVTTATTGRLTTVHVPTEARWLDYE